MVASNDTKKTISSRAMNARKNESDFFLRFCCPASRSPDGEMFDASFFSVQSHSHSDCDWDRHWDWSGEARSPQDSFVGGSALFDSNMIN